MDPDGLCKIIEAAEANGGRAMLMHHAAHDGVQGYVASRPENQETHRAHLAATRRNGPASNVINPGIVT
jgi:hypothetical protein